MKDSDNLVKRIMTGKDYGKRPRGSRPIYTLVREDPFPHKTLHTAEDRSRWRKTIRDKIMQKGRHDEGSTEKNDARRRNLGLILPRRELDLIRTGPRQLGYAYNKHCY